jgi:hypothetical protein
MNMSVRSCHEAPSFAGLSLGPASQLGQDRALLAASYLGEAGGAAG